MEKMNYRETLEWLKEIFGGKLLLSVADVSRGFGVDRRTVQKRYPFQDSYIEITKLASLLSCSAGEVRRTYRMS